MSNLVHLSEDQQLLERQRALDRINVLALEMITAPEPTVTLRAILEQLVRLTGMHSAECYLREADGEEKRAAATGVSEVGRMSTLRQQAMRGLNLMAGEKRVPFIITDLPADANDLLRELAKAAGYGSLVYLPICGAENERTGSVVLYGMLGHDFSPSEQALLETFARQIATGLCAAKMYQKEQERSGHLQLRNVISITLGRVAVHLHGAHNVHDLLRILSVRLRTMALYCAVLLRDGDDNFRVQPFALKPATVRAIHIASGVDIEAAAYPLLSKPWLHKILTAGAPVLVRNVRQHAAHWLPQVEPERLQRALWMAGLTPSAELALLPLLIQGKVEGMLLMWGVNINQDALPALGIFASHVAQSLDSVRLREQIESAQMRLRELTRQFINVQENERARISRQLHDEAGQSLTALKIQLFLLHKAVPPDQHYLIEALQHSIDDVGSLVQQMRTLSHEVHPPALEDLGLNAALDGCCQTFAQSYKVLVNYRGAPVGKISRESGITLYRFLQEALTNTARHSDARLVDVTLKRNSTMLVLSVRDDGHGFDVTRVRQGIGLRSIRERLELIDGEFQVESQEGEGTRLTARVPLESETQEEE